jgi:hypothetical protein
LAGHGDQYFQVKLHQLDCDSFSCASTCNHTDIHVYFAMTFHTLVSWLPGLLAIAVNDAWALNAVIDAVARDIVPEHRRHRQVRPYMAGCTALWRVQGIVTLNRHFKGVVKTI